MDTSFDIQMMARALQLARRGQYSATPNPSVGCVLVREGRVIGEGFTCPAGGNHAEIEALCDAGDAVGSTAYVTLEPCSHQGKTGPCSAALIQAGVTRVVVALADPQSIGIRRWPGTIACGGYRCGVWFAGKRSSQGNSWFYCTYEPRTRAGEG